MLDAVFSNTLPDDVLEMRLVNCGGDSIMAATIAARCFRQYGVKVPVSVLLRAERLQEVVEYIAEHAVSSVPATPVAASRPAGRFEQNAAQQLIYFAHTVDASTTAYNIPLLLRTASAIPAARFQQAVSDAARQFPMLFSRFTQDSTGLWFAPGAPHDIALQTFSTTGEAADHFVQPFDLGAGVLLRAGIVPFNGIETALLLDFSHIAADGLSVGLFIQALKAQLTGTQNTPETRAFWPEVESTPAGAEAFWQHRLQDVVAHPLWPADRQLPPAAPLGYAVEYLLIDATLAADMRSLAARLGTTPFSVLLLAYALLQTSFTHEWRSHVGVVVSGRADADLADVFGMFVNAVIVPFALDAEGPAGPAIHMLAEQFLGTLDYQNYPFQAQLHHVRNHNDSPRPTLDALLAYQNIDYQKIDLAGSRFRSFCEAKKMAQLPQVIHVFDLAEQGYEIQWEYCPHRFDADTIGVFTNNLLRILRRLTGSADTAALKTLIEAATSKTRATPIVAADFDF
ncbi:condensation domain-containing protein [Andreprevotia sp. IGB-42]|uniref:condensation domain-containing protein n=1 Tax=Andreprevotia sp. IGB-42 TaxID=2497473 RepID=UPI00135A7CE6|nr:condensation domain-containing protein [Andreprevotia sp. IGB-42]